MTEAQLRTVVEEVVKALDAKGFLKTGKCECEGGPKALKGEIELARRLYAIQTRDSRIGYEATNHYFYVPVDLAEKVLNCRDLLERRLPGAEQKYRNHKGAKNAKSHKE